MNSPQHACRPVGLQDLAARLDVEQRTPQQWQHRGLLPEPDWMVSGRPAWCWPHTMAPWLARTGRAGLLAQPSDDATRPRP